LDEVLLYNLSPDEIVVISFLLGFAIVEEPLTVTEQLVVSAIFGFIGQALVVNAAQRALIAAREEEEKAKEFEEKIKTMQKDIAELKKAIAKK